MTTPAGPQLPAYIRTYIPLIVMFLSDLIVKHGFTVPFWFAGAVAGAVAALYYAVVRLLERYVEPRFGWLLGHAKQPAYLPGPAPAPAEGETSVAVSEPADPPVDNTDPAAGPVD
jgi:hypothetical protein